MPKKNKVEENTLNKSIPQGFEFIISIRDVIERENFGSFELVKTAKGIMYKNYTGYHVWTTQYSTGIDGKAGQFSLYRALDELLKLKKLAKNHPDDIYFKEITNKQMFDSDIIVIEANLTRPMTVFTDVSESLKAASEYIEWLKKKQVKIQKAMSKLEKEDEKANAEFDASIKNTEQLKSILNNGDKN